ncbi:type IVB secretion system protein IcmJDotN [Thiotrichales bacterium 19S3-7]|nr:type IVB secretion system protein IcmJDotN [Thiotrichales bacterium 19S3-7]MCF6800808.1 type IVB secretion system protein IcmJDotN [Thiotrichales bacterium 19S3-11]
MTTSNLFNLQFEAVPGNYQRFCSRKNSSLFQKVRSDVIQRYHNCCAYCGISVGDDELEVVNINHNYTDNNKKNFAAACQFCTQILLMDQYTANYSGNDCMIYFPNMTQPQLNHLYRALWYHIKNKTKEAAFKSKELLAELSDASKTLNQVVGTELSNPGVFVHYLYGRSSDRQLLKKIRWLPGLDRIEELIDTTEADKALQDNPL